MAGLGGGGGVSGQWLGQMGTLGLQSRVQVGHREYGGLSYVLRKGLWISGKIREGQRGRRMKFWPPYTVPGLAGVTESNLSETLKSNGSGNGKLSMHNGHHRAT